MAEREEELKSLLMKVKEEREKVGLKFNIQKIKIMASSPITSWQIDGETIETVTDIIFLGSKITADGDCNHEIKRRLLLGRKAMTNLLLLPGRFSRANSVRPHRRQPTRLPRPWDPPGKNTGLGCHCLLQYADVTTLMAESEELESLLMKVKEESENVGLNLNIQKMKIMASSHRFMGNRWGNNENSDRLYFLGFQNHCRW